MGFDEFCSYHHIDLKDAYAALASYTELQPGEVLYLSGSLAEGLGNTKSDLDAFLITDRTLDLPTHGTIIIVPFEACIIDLELWSTSKAANAITLLQACPHAEERDPRLSLRFRHGDLAFLHRLLVGYPLTENHAFRSLQSRVDSRAVSRIIFDQSSAVIAGLVTDIAGLLQAADHDAAAVLAQRLLGFILDAVLAVQGNTNPSQKWRFQKLRHLEAEGFPYALPPCLTVPSAYEYFLSLYLMRDLRRPDYIDYVHECLRLARHTLPWGQKLFCAHSPFDWIAERPDRRSIGDGGSLEPGGEPENRTSGVLGIDDELQCLPMLEPEVTAWWQRGDVILYGGRGKGELTVGEIALEALRYFDGKTTLGEAARRLSTITPASPRQLAQAITDLSICLGSYGFLDELEGQSVDTRTDVPL